MSRQVPFILRLTRFLVGLFAVQGGLIKASYAVDLNAPAQKFIPTVKSEIRRGDSTIFLATKKYEATDVLGFFEGVSEVLNNERRTGNDTDAFYLGAYFAAWIDLNSHLMVLQKISRTSRPEYQFDKREGLEYFRDFRKTQKGLRIDDRTLIQNVLKMNYDNVELQVRSWDEISAHSKSDD